MKRQDTLGQFLLNALYRRGVRKVFGIPGDFALNFFQALENYKKIQLITLSHEPGLAFAADGFSRISGDLGVVATTFGAGALNMINGVACAYAEKSPLVIISGAPGMTERGSGISFHHQAKTIQSQRNIFQEITSAQAILEDLETAPALIEKTLTIATQLSSPVYIEIPRDRVNERLFPNLKVENFSLPEDLAATGECAEEIVQKLSHAKRPVMMVGVEVHRFDLRHEVVRLAEKIQIPVVSSFMGRSTFPMDHPQFSGIYLGPAGHPKVQDLVENSDALLLLGVLFADTNFALRLRTLNPKNIIHALNREVSVAHHHYKNVPLPRLIHQLQNISKKGDTQRVKHFTSLPKLKTEKFFNDSPLTVEAIVQGINYIFKKHGARPVIADNGDCLFASIEVETPDLLASGYYATMGFGVPAGMGAQLAGAPRPLILVGDGAFQMTGAEISHCHRLKINPIVIVFNNHRWEMLKTIQPESNYFDLPPWNYAKMAENWNGRGLTARTKREFLQALKLANDEKKFVIIDATLPEGETSQALRNYLKRIRE